MRVLLLLSTACALLSACSAEEPAASGPHQTPVDVAAEAPPPRAEPVPEPEPQGYHLRGRVTDPWSGPVAGARVSVHASGAEASAEETTSDEAGAYALELPGPGPWTIRARHPEVGVRSLDLGEVAQGERRVPDLRLQGEGVLSGRLVDAAGTPLAGETLIAFARSLLQQEVLFGREEFDIDTLPIYAPVLDSPHYVRGKGFHHAQTTTAADGGFHFEGLAPGDYLFYSPALGNEPWSSVDREWHATSEEEIELVSPLCSLVVSVPDDRVAPVPDDPAQRRRLGPIVVHPTLPCARGRAALLSRTLSTAHGAERNVFRVPPGDYVVSAVTYPPAGQWGLTLYTEGKVSVAPGSTEQSLVLDFAPQDRPRGRLKVEVNVPGGFEKPERFHFLTAETAQPIEVSEYSPFPEPRYGEWLDVPEGEYIIALLPFEDFVGRREVVELGPVYRRVSVEAGKDTEATLESTWGGEFRLRLSAPRLSIAGDLARPEGFDEPSWERLVRNLSKNCGATVTLLRDDGGPALALRLRDPIGRLGERRDRMLPGEVFEHFGAIEPGEYTLWVMLDGFELYGQPLTLVEREVVEVEVQLGGT